MKIVIVSGFITPRISPRSFRATELAKAFAGMGHDVTLMASLGKYDYTEFTNKYNVNSPVAIAYNSTFLNILKIICFMYLASRLLNVKFLEFFPIKILSIIILHGALVAVIVKVVQLFALHAMLTFYQVLISGMIYLILMLGTGRLFKIDYLIAFKPLIKIIKK